MKAVFINRHGGTDVLEYGEQPRPIPRSGQVLIEVRAASVNPRDWLLREGKYVFRYLMPGFPLILGSDVSGVVVETGPRTVRFKVGDAVFGMQTPFGRMGGYAEYVAIAETALAIKPESVSHEEAAAAPCAGLTAYDALVGIARVAVGSKVTVIGGSGGVGSYAVQLAAALGTEVTAVTSGRNAEFVGTLGARHLIDYTQHRFTDSVRRQDVVFDTIGRETLAKCAESLAPDGRYITTIPNLRTGLQAVTSGVARRLRGGHGQSAHVVLVRSDGKNLEKLAALMVEGKLRSVIDSVFPLSDIRAAHEKSRTWRTRGKIVLSVRS